MKNGSEEQGFQAYTGTKTVKAMPMGSEEARRHGAMITEETAIKNHCNPGYLVEYPDGYRSWSPKKAFEDAYKVSETEVDRMKIELADLSARIKKATENLYNPDLIGPGDDYLWSLDKQLDAMREYAARLRERIAIATRPEFTVAAKCSCECGDNLSKTE